MKIKLNTYSSLQECSAKINSIHDIFQHQYHRAPAINLMPHQIGPKATAKYELIANGEDKTELAIVKKILGGLI